MRWRGPLTYALCAVVLLAASLPALAEPLREGDTNSDGTVDVQDIQCLVAHILTSTANGAVLPRRDINGDGQVDILDLQTVTALATTLPEQPDAPAQPTHSKGVMPSNLRMDGPLAASAVAPISTTRLPEMGAGHLIPAAYAANPLQHQARYLFLLTPHAPPLDA